MNTIVTILRESRLARFLLPAGLILIICGVIFFNANRQNQDYEKTEATVIDVELEQEAGTDSEGNHVDASYTVKVKYTVDGKEYEAELNGVGKSDVGDKMDIFYDPEDPSRVTMTKSLILPMAIIAGGIAMLAGGIVSSIHAVKKIRRMKEQEKEWANGN